MARLFAAAIFNYSNSETLKRLWEINVGTFVRRYCSIAYRAALDRFSPAARHHQDHETFKRARRIPPHRTQEWPDLPPGSSYKNS
jgi:hypothetical protein